jgi:hypothetical protein
MTDAEKLKVAIAALEKIGDIAVPDADWRDGLNRAQEIAQMVLTAIDPTYKNPNPPPSGPALRVIK